MKHGLCGTRRRGGKTRFSWGRKSHGFRLLFTCEPISVVLTNARLRPSLRGDSAFFEPSIARSAPRFGRLGMAFEAQRLAHWRVGVSWRRLT
jgi:hypothetical protein